MVTVRDLRFGIEIEGGGIPRARAARAILRAVGGRIVQDTQVLAPDGRLWKIVADASLTTWSPELRCEMVSPILGYDDIQLLQEVTRALRAAGMQVSPKCGIHIHVDASSLDGKQLTSLAKMVYQQEELLVAALGISDDRRARYCKPMDHEFILRLLRHRPRSKDDLCPLWYGQRDVHPTHFHTTRYFGVNFHAIWDKGTVEFRYFESTLHAGKVKAYLQFILALTAKAANARAVAMHRRHFDPANAKYSWRCFLLRLGLLGDEYKTARKHLLALMPGDAAFRGGKAQRQAAIEKAKKRPPDETKTDDEAGATMLRPSC